MFCCALLATLFAQPLALLGAVGIGRPKTQTHPAVGKARVLQLPLPMLAIIAELAFLTTAGIAFESRLEPQRLVSLHRICRLFSGPESSANTPP